MSQAFKGSDQQHTYSRCNHIAQIGWSFFEGKLVHIVIILQFIIDFFSYSTTVEVNMDQVNGRILLFAVIGYNFIKLLIAEQMFSSLTFW